MNGRRARILVETVDRYIHTQRPVSSQELVRTYRYRFSSATVRNELLALEREGYLYKPHPSAGRVPTSRGFRFFAEWLLAVAERQEPRVRLPVEPSQGPVGELASLFRRTAFLLATLTHALGFVLFPPRERLRCTAVMVRRLAPGMALAVRVFPLGAVQSQILSIPLDLAPEELADVEKFLELWLKDHPLDELPLTTWSPPSGWHSRVSLGALSVLRGLAQSPSEGGLYVEGWPQLLTSLALRSADWALARGQSLLKLLEEEARFRALVAEVRRGAQGLAVHVGDGSVPEFAELSVVSAPYWTDEDVLGVIGPIWMDYAKAFSATRYVAGRLRALLASPTQQEVQP